MYEYITFLTDFGLQDDFVGVCRGVMKGIARDAQLLDVTHGIAPQAVVQGALVLARSSPTFRRRCTSPSSTRASGAPAARSQSVPTEAGFLSDLTTACS